MENQEQPKQVTMTDRLSSIEEKLDILSPQIKVSAPSGKIKWFKLPWGFKGKQKKILKKPTKIQIIYMRTNTRMEPMIADIIDGAVRIDNKIVNVNRLMVWQWLGKIPTLLVPEWSIQPIGTKDYYDVWKDYTDGQRGAEAQKIIIRALERAKVEDKKPFNFKIWIWILLGLALVGILFFWKGGGN